MQEFELGGLPVFVVNCSVTCACSRDKLLPDGAPAPLEVRGASHGITSDHHARHRSSCAEPLRFYDHCQPVSAITQTSQWIFYTTVPESPQDGQHRPAHRLGAAVHKPEGRYWGPLDEIQGRLALVYTRYAALYRGALSDNTDGLTQHFPIGHLNQNELSFQIDYFVTADPNTEHLHNQLIAGIYGNVTRDPPEPGVAPWVSANDKPTVLSKPVSGDAAEQRLKTEVMQLPARDRRRIKEVPDVSHLYEYDQCFVRDAAGCGTSC